MDDTSLFKVLEQPIKVKGVVSLKFREFLKKHKRKVTAACTTAAITMTSAVSAFAEGTTGTADASVTGAFTSMKGDLLATIGVVAAAAVTVYGVFLAWKYGKKLFNRVAN